MRYVYPVMYLDENETFSFSAENYTSNATGADISELLELFDLNNLFTLEYLWWIVPTVIIMILILNIYTIR